MNDAPRTFPSIPRAHSLAGAQALQARYQETGPAHLIVLGDCTEDRETYFVATVREARRLVAAGYEVLN